MYVSGCSKSFLFILDFQHFDYYGPTCSSLYIYLSLDLMSFRFCNFIWITTSDKFSATISSNIFFTLASGTKQPMSDILILSHKSLKRSVHVFFFLFSSYWMVAIDSSLGRLLPSSLCAKINQWILYFIYFIF